MKQAGLILCAAMLAGATPASAATPSITGDAGTPVPLTSGLSLRHMAPDVTFAFTAEEAYYAARVVGPAGPASIGTDCLRTSDPFPERVVYQGNGTYTVFFKAAADRDACAAATEQSVPFTIAAGASLVPPDKQPLLSRPAGSGIPTDFQVPVNGNPGADSYEFKYAPNATLGPDGGITGTPESAFVNSSTGAAAVRFAAPGRYTLLVRAKSFRSDVFTPWSPRLDVTVDAPFDFLVPPRLSDSRGPTYAVVGQIREKSARGRVTIALSRGSKAKRFKTIGKPRISKSGKFKLKFRVSRIGKYVMRFSYKGSATVRRGSIKYPIRFFRTFG
jgi:hypothetical protein